MRLKRKHESRSERHGDGLILRIKRFPRPCTPFLIYGIRNNRLLIVTFIETTCSPPPAPPPCRDPILAFMCTIIMVCGSPHTQTLHALTFIKGANKGKPHIHLPPPPPRPTLCHDNDCGPSFVKGIEFLPQTQIF